MTRALAAVLVGVALVSGPAAPASAEAVPRAERVLVFSLPTVSWAEANALDLPNLSALLDESAIGALSTRAVDRETTPGDGYATLNAGTRSDGDAEVDGLAFEVGETYLGQPAEDIFTRRTGIPVSEGLVSLAVPALEAVNDSLDFGTEVGALGRALRGGGAHAAVIANADGAAEEPDTAKGRQAVVGLVDAEGLVPGGRVSDRLLEADAAAPFGHRLDVEAVVAVFEGAWVDRAVVLVEASDVVRAEAYRTGVSPQQQRTQRRDALRRTDALLGRLLQRVDPATDAVLVVGPYPRAGDDHLTLAALRAPGVEPGLLRSAVTRRTGFVTLVDVAPTVLSLLDIDRPGSMEGRRFTGTDAGGTGADRRSALEQANAEAQWRDDVAPGGTGRCGAARERLVLAAGWALVRRSPRVAAGVEGAGLALVVVLPLTFVAGGLPFHEWGTGPYALFLVGAAAAIGYGLPAALRGRPLDPLLAVLLATVLLLAVDVLVGGPLQLNTVFGYSPTVAGRFAGFGNLAFAVLAAAVTILTGLITARIAGRRGVAGALGVMAAVLVLVASPFWGSDVGGALTLVPTLVVTAALLLGVRVRARIVVSAGLVTFVVLLVAGFVDLARPGDQRTHLGRLFEEIGQDGAAAAGVVLARKLGANLTVLTSSQWVLMVPIAVGFLLFLGRRAPAARRAMEEAVPRHRAALAGFTVAAVLGFALNDSGIAVPGLMLAVLTASLAHLALRLGGRRSAPYDDEVRGVGPLPGALASPAETAP